MVCLRREWPTMVLPMGPRRLPTRRQCAPIPQRKYLVSSSTRCYGNADEWFAIIQRCAKTDSSDSATFPSLGLFLQKLGRAQPLIVLRFIEKLDERLAGFLGIMLSGLAESDSHAEASAKILQWVSEDRYLNQIAHYFRFAP